MNKRIIFRILRVLLLVYALIGILVYYGQDYLVLHPEQLPADHKFSFAGNFREVTIPYNATTSINIVQFKPADSLVKGVVLYFHGNRDNITRYETAAPPITKKGYEVWMIDYPGFGKSTGVFTEERVYDWALIFYKLARARFAPDSITIYGRSLGSGVAAQLASVRDCRRLILETPYYSLPSVFSSYLPVYPFEKLIHYKFPTWQYLQQVDAPVTIFHGDNDITIPLRNAKKLIPYLKKGSEFVEIKNGRHNDLSSFPAFSDRLNSLFP